MFEDMFSGGEQGSPIDILNSLLDPANITMKTDLNMTQIQIAAQIYWFKLIKDPTNKDKTVAELKVMWAEYVMQLMVSYKRESRKESIKGVTDMSNKMMETFSLMQGGMRQQ